MRPTFTCFDDAIGFVLEANIDSLEWDAYTIVHGICLAPRPSNVRYVHAWVERGGYALQVMLDDHGERFGVEIALAEFRRLYRVQHETRYTIRQAAEANLRSGHMGPWLPKYQKMQRARRGKKLRTWVGGAVAKIERGA